MSEIRDPVPGPMPNVEGGRELVRATGISKSYRDGESTIEVLRDLDLLAQESQLIAIVGASGSGKSTLLNILGTLDHPDRGEVEICGVDPFTLGEQELADFRNQRLGFIFQFHQLLPDFRIVENVYMPGRIGGWSADELEARALDLLAEVGLAERASAFPEQLSGGERQRVALCRALFMEPRLLLADEPTGNLDAGNADRVLDVLLEMQSRRGTTGLLVTHNPRVARRCHQTWTLAEGRLQRSPDDTRAENG